MGRLVRDHRLVTLLGAGGLGKTRLGYRVLEDVAPRFPGATWGIDLADLVDPSLLGYTLAIGMGMPPAADENDVSVIVDHIGDRPTFVYVDNCEHLLEACAELISAMLSRCPRLRVLTSSRQALGVIGERVYAVPAMRPDEAVELFKDRAVSALPSFAMTETNQLAVAELCMALDGVPLAIELAAVQVRTFTPKAMTSRLLEQGSLLSSSARGDSLRHSSLEACIEWSYRLCTEPERLLWQRLATFGGGFPLKLVETACPGDGLEAGEVAQALAGLVDKSLVERDLDDPEGRYRMLEVIRQFGVAKLTESGDVDTWRRRHRDYYLDLALRFDDEWTGPRQEEWIERFSLEHANLRLAFDFSSADPSEAPQGMRMAAVLEHYFASRGGGPEAVHWLRIALGHGTGTPYERAFALRVGCFISALIAAMDTAASMLEELLALAADTDDDRIRAFAMYAHSHVRTFQGDPVTGAEIAADGTELLHRVGHAGREANLHFLRGMMLGWADQPDEAAAAYQRCLDITEPLGERWLTSYSQWGLGVDALQTGQLDEAIRLERAALKAKVEFGDQLGVGLTISALAWAAAAERRAKEAAVLLGAAEAIWDEIGTSVATMPILSRRREIGIATTRELLSEVEYDELHQHGRELPQPDAVAIALGRVRVGRVGPESLLTRRETEVARLLATGITNKEIAESLVLSVRTVETHVENIMRKLEVDSRAKVAAALASEPGAT